MSKKEKNIADLLISAEEKKDKLENFVEILESLKSTDPKKKVLWKEIYQNAVNDRERAAILFTEAYKTMGNSSSDHISIGNIMSKYLERMTKSNDQILGLADLINKAEQKEEKIVPDELYNQIMSD
jgi:DNA-binding SARP family transcriptional activator